MVRYEHSTTRLDVLCPSVLDGYGEWVTKVLAEGFTGNFLTFEFKPIDGSQSVMLGGMKAAFDLFYRRIVTDIIRIRSGRRPPVAQFPLLIATPDMPVPKDDKSCHRSNRAASINDGKHYHAILLIPGRNILKTTFDNYPASEIARLLRGTAIISVQAEPITYTPAYLADYAVKSLKRRRFGSDDVLVLPRTWHEVSRPSLRLGMIEALAKRPNDLGGTAHESHC